MLIIATDDEQERTGEQVPVVPVTNIVLKKLTSQKKCPEIIKFGVFSRYYWEKTSRKK